MNPRALLMMVGGLILAGTSGYLASEALSQGSQTPTKTVTVNVGTGTPGPAGPAGPPGPPGPAGTGGAEKCPAGSEFGKLVINHPGGQTSILTCILD